jgi:hypothetical protein
MQSAIAFATASPFNCDDSRFRMIDFLARHLRISEQGIGRAFCRRLFFIHGRRVLPVGINGSKLNFVLFFHNSSISPIGPFLGARPEAEVPVFRIQ